MNMISTIKDDLKELLVSKCDLAVDKVVFMARDEVLLMQQRAWPCVSIITGDGVFDNSAVGKVRGMRSIPVELRFYGDTEIAVLDIVEKLYSCIPVGWSYEGQDGEVEIVGETHSDHIARVVEYYACFVGLRFSVRVLQS